jgi:hypothetical protein
MQQREPFVDPETLPSEVIEAERSRTHDEQKAAEEEGPLQPAAADLFARRGRQKIV